MIQIVSFEERVAKIQCASDVKEQIEQAKNCLKLLQNQMKHQKTLREKVAMSQAIKEAEVVLRKLRQSRPNLEGAKFNISKSVA